jgi:hypothetical protein
LHVDRADTQPTKARWESLADSETDPLKRRLVGGTKAGNGAWALAWVDTVMEVRIGSNRACQCAYLVKRQVDPEMKDLLSEDRERLLREAEGEEGLSIPVS